jgi:hypothetical protein
VFIALLKKPSIVNKLQLRREYLHPDLLLMELPREMSIYTDTTRIPLGLIVHIHILGRRVLFGQTSMVFMNSKVHQRFIPSMSSRADLLIPGAGWLASFLVSPVLTIETDNWQGFDQCAVLLNMEFERVFYKNNFAAGVELLSIYMICKMSLVLCPWKSILTMQRRRNELG